jgi:hypothetical protein
VNEEKKSKEKEGDVVKDDIIHDYDSVLKESGVLTSVSGIIFGFLLNISINSSNGFTIEDSIILMISLYSISFAISFFVMPIMNESDIITNNFYDILFFSTSILPTKKINTHLQYPIIPESENLMNYLCI